MVESQFSWDDDVEPQVRKIAKRVFRSRKDRDELVDDTVSLVWEWWTTAANRMQPHQYANYACKWVLKGKHLQRSERSVDVPNCSRGQVKALRGELSDIIASRPGENPATLARVQLDFAAWLPTLTARQADILDCLLQGESGVEVAEKLGITPGAVSQNRKGLGARWLEFTS